MAEKPSTELPPARTKRSFDGNLTTFERKRTPFPCGPQQRLLAAGAVSNALTRCFDAFDEGLHMSVTFGLVVKAGAGVCRVSELLALGLKTTLRGYYA